MVRKLLLTANSRIQAFLSPPLFYELIPDKALKEQTYHSRETFQYVFDNFRPPSIVKERIMAFEATLLAVLTYYRQGTTFQSDAFNRGFNSPSQLDRNFWKWSIEMFRQDDACPHRNYAVNGFNFKSPQDVMREHQVRSQLMLGMFSLVPSFQKLVDMILFLGGLDHTYVEVPKLNSPNNQKRSFFKAKNAHCIKFGALVNHVGKLVFYTPASASNVPSNADGNLLMLQRHYEETGQVKRVLGEYLFPPPPIISIVTVDKGYPRNKGRDRGTNLTLDQDYANNRVASPHSRILYPLRPGDKLLNRELRYEVLNPVPAGTRRKLTCAEANCSRFCTLIRWIVETFFGAVSQFRITHGILPYQFLHPIGTKLEECSNCTKAEIIYNNIFCMVNRNHPGFNRNPLNMELPDDITEFEFGQSFYNCLFLANEFCPFENVIFSENLNTSPNLTRAFNTPDGWAPVNINNADIDIFQMTKSQFIKVTKGLYHIKCANIGITNMVETEQEQFIKDHPEYQNIDWQEFHRRCSGLTREKFIFIKDEYNQPGNWNEDKFRPWFPRRLIWASVPSRHSGINKTVTNHKVVISIIPLSWNLPDNFVNQFGFEDEPLKRLVKFGCVGKDCPIGGRVLGCCAHVSTVLAYLCIFAFNPDLFETTHQPINIFATDNPQSLNHQLLLPTQNNQQQNQPPGPGQQPPQGGNIVPPPAAVPGPGPLAAGPGQVPPLAVPDPVPGAADPAQVPPPAGPNQGPPGHHVGGAVGGIDLAPNPAPANDQIEMDPIHEALRIPREQLERDMRGLPDCNVQ